MPHENTPPQTLEEAQAEILRLQDELQTAKADAENYRGQVTEKASELEKVREINQQYFLRLSAQHQTPTPPEEEEDPPTCEEFAKTLNI